MFRVVHYQNHFFGQSGRGEHVGMEPVCRRGAFGPGSSLSNLVADLGGIASTIVCGDDYMFLNMEAGTEHILALLAEQRADALVAGPAFNAGRYGLACGAVCEAAAGRLGIPAATAMYPENPGFGAYPAGVHILETASSIAGMRATLPAMASLVRALLHNDRDRAAALSVVGPVNAPSRIVDPAPPVSDLSAARLVLVTEGGLVPAGNPDMLETSGASRVYRYEVSGTDALSPGVYKCVHGGVDRAVINACPERLVPFSAAKEMERLGKIGSLAGYFYSTTGNGTSPDHSRVMGKNLADRLRDDEISAVLLTATWATGIRCGATISIELERAGLPTALICVTPEMAVSLGVPRTVRGGGVSYPSGDPGLDPNAEAAFRTVLVGKALEVLSRSWRTGGSRRSDRIRQT